VAISCYIRANQPTKNSGNLATITVADRRTNCGSSSGTQQYVDIVLRLSDGTLRAKQEDCTHSN
jgi:hypothetical protein